MRKHLLLTFIPALLVLGTLRSQDQHFTQYYAAPLTLNPALTGAFNGSYRLSLIYRDQWRSVLDNPYVTFAGAMDFRMGLRYKGKRSEDYAGVGVLFFNDQVAEIGFSTTQISVSGAYHKALGAVGDQYLTLGFQWGVTQRNVNYANLQFEDQFDGDNGYDQPTGEDLPENNFAFGDYSAGIHYAYAPYRRTAYYAGLALYHVGEPQVSFYASNEEARDRNDNRLYRKLVGHLGMRIPLSKSVQLTPRGLIYLQGPHLAINAGSNFRFLLDDLNGTALHLGGWVRPVRGREEELTLDAVVALAGIEYRGFLIGLSYDASFNQLSVGSSRQGAFEISLSFLGNTTDEAVICPKF